MAGTGHIIHVHMSHGHVSHVRMSHCHVQMGHGHVSHVRMSHCHVRMSHVHVSYSSPSPMGHVPMHAMAVDCVGPRRTVRQTQGVQPVGGVLLGRTDLPTVVTVPET